MITVLLVRHADIDVPPASDDPPLNAAGRRRAETLAHVAGTAGVTSVFTSSLIRAKQTVEPLVARVGLNPAEVPPPSVLAQRVVSGTLGGVVLIAGHSNTIPEMMVALGVSSGIPAIGEREFDNLFVVTVAESVGSSALSLKYGKPSH
jgi:phosphohistidine phosphatase SixA